MECGKCGNTKKITKKTTHMEGEIIKELYFCPNCGNIWSEWYYWRD